MNAYLQFFMNDYFVCNIYLHLTRRIFFVFALWKVDLTPYNYNLIYKQQINQTCEQNIELTLQNQKSCLDYTAVTKQFQLGRK